MLSFVPVIICQLVVSYLPFCLSSDTSLLKILLLWEFFSLGLKGRQGVEINLYHIIQACGDQN